jgi:hypothetical protein
MDTEFRDWALECPSLNVDALIAVPGADRRGRCLPSKLTVAEFYP